MARGEWGFEASFPSSGSMDAQRGWHTSLGLQLLPGRLRDQDGLLIAIGHLIELIWLVRTKPFAKLGAWVWSVDPPES